MGRDRSGRKKRPGQTKQQKQRNREEKVANEETAEFTNGAPAFVDARCEALDTNLFNLSDKLLGCGVSIYLSQIDCNIEWLDDPALARERWGIVGTLPPRRANKLNASEHEEYLKSVEGKPGVAAVISGVEYGKPPHGETKPCASREDQRAAFEVHCKAALRWKVPLVLVIRPDAREVEESERAIVDCIQWLDEFGVPREYRICFSSWIGSPKAALVVLKRFPNSYLGLNGSITFRASDHLREIAFDAPINRILLESDAPHTPPTNLTVSHSPWTILTIATCVAEQRRTDLQSVITATNENAATFFSKALKTIDVQATDEISGDESDVSHQE